MNQTITSSSLLIVLNGKFQNIFFKELGKAIELTHTMSAVPAKDPSCCRYGDKDPGEGCTQDTVALGK